LNGIMDMDQEQKRTAWLDGELPPEEAAAFLASLPEDEREALETEQRLDESILSLIGADAPCPAQAWQRVVNAVRDSEAAATRSRFQWRQAALIAGPIAAVLLVMFAVLVPAGSDATPTFLKIAGATVPELAEHSAVLGEREQVEQFMRQYGFNIRLHEVSLPAHETADGRNLRLLGARAATYRGETVLVLLYSCCNKPAQMVVTARGGEAERAIRTAMDKKAVRMARELCPKYIGAVVGETERAETILALLGASE
jgi:hypothetical protein